MNALVKWLKRLEWLIPLVTLADWLALKTAVSSHPPWILALLAGTWILVLAVHLGLLLRDLWLGRRKRWSVSAQVALLTGVLVALGGGMANWALSFQGFVLLHEGEAVPLHGGGHFRRLEAGPLFPASEMDVVILLEEVELVPAPGGAFYPTSHLRLQRTGEDPVGIEVSSQRGAAGGALRFFQGAFGFAPRSVILQGDEIVFDRLVPFTTERHGPNGVAFQGHLTVEEERLEVDGKLDLSTLDDRMRGHTTLLLSVARDGNSLGRGSLLPGHFAELAEGYRVGFTDLSKWSEIDIKRRNYRQVVMLGGLLGLAGGIFWPVARWRGW